MLYHYDKTSPTSIENHGKKMIGKSFQDIANNPINFEYSDISADGQSEHPDMFAEGSSEYSASHARSSYKGGIGILVEECHFGYKANSDARPDFHEAGVELKVTPYKKSNKKFTAKERLVLTMINYFDVVKERDFEHSHVWEKCQLILLVYYLYIKGVSAINSTIDYVQLYTPPPEDLEIIKSDYKKIIDKIKAGKAHELSEGDTLYLGACTKAQKSTDRRKQPFSSIDAKPRAFSYKQSYMTHVLNNYIIPGKRTYKSQDCILHSPVSDFEGYITNKIKEYAGKSMEELCSIMNIVYNSNTKNLGSLIAFRILGIRSNKAEEFEKAGIAVKTIRIKLNGKIKENMSFPHINYEQLATEIWDDCTFGNYLRQTRFFFVIFKENKDHSFVLDSCKFWNIPYSDLEGNVRKVWQETHDIIADGNLTLRINEKGIVSNNFPGIKDNDVSHVRPHGQNKYDVTRLPAGTHINISSDSLGTWPYSDQYTKQCFWLNNSYILKQITE